MEKIKEISGYARVTLDKLQSIRADLVRNDGNQQDWKFQQLVEVFEKWTVRSPIPSSDKRNPEKFNGYNKSYQAKQTKSEYVYCEKPGHRSSDCKTAKTVTELRNILSDKKLCSNCAGAKHRAEECCSAKTYLTCKNKQSTSICDKLADSKSDPILETTETNVTYQVAIIKVNGVKCRVLLDTGSGSSYISESFTQNKFGQKRGQNHRNTNKFRH